MLRSVSVLVLLSVGCGGAAFDDASSPLEQSDAAESSFGGHSAGSGGGSGAGAAHGDAGDELAFEAALVDAAHELVPIEADVDAPLDSMGDAYRDAPGFTDGENYCGIDEPDGATACWFVGGGGYCDAFPLLRYIWRCPAGIAPSALPGGCVESANPLGDEYCCSVGVACH